MEIQVDIFTSYSDHDAKFVKPLIQLLPSGAKVLHDRDAIPTGKTRAAFITEAIGSCRVMYVFWCNHLALSPEAQNEYQQAIALRKDVVVVVLDETPLPANLTEYQLVDLREIIGKHEDVVELTMSLEEGRQQQRLDQGVTYGKDAYTGGNFFRQGWEERGGQYVRRLTVERAIPDAALHRAAEVLTKNLEGQVKGERDPTPEPPATDAQAAPVAATTTAYPDIQVSNQHPIAGAELTIDVALAAAPVVGSSGRVDLPASDPTHVYTLDVTLLLGTTLRRDTLNYSVAAGTTKPAHFTVEAPAIAGFDRATTTIRVNFYLNKRWCGQGTRTIEISGNETVPPVEAPPSLPPGGSDDLPPLHFDPSDRPPDLTIRIYRGESDRDFVWECTSPRVNIPLPENPQHAIMPLDDTAKDFVRKHFKKLASKSLASVDFADIEGIGEQIYKTTPRHFKDAYWLVWNTLQDRFESVQIVTDEPYVPWELMRLADDRRAPGVAPEFLGVRHSVGRWLDSERASMRQRVAVRSIAVSASDYKSVPTIQQKLPWAGEERAFLVDSYGAHNVPLTSENLLDFLKHGCAQAMHFACHGQMFIDDPLSSELVCEDTPNVLKPTMVNRVEVRQGLGREKPLVFLNACEIGAGAAALSLVAGFPAAFLDAGASAVVCPLWVVNDKRAHTVSELFYTKVFANPGKPIGHVMREIRAGWRDGQHLTFLAYVLYGDPLASVTYTKE